GLGPLNPFGDDGAGGDPDGDGLTNLLEQALGKSPIDYYNGILPTVSITNGNNQSGVTNAFLPIPLTVQVTVTPVSGAWVTNAPATSPVSVRLPPVYRRRRCSGRPTAAAGSPTFRGPRPAH